MSLFTIEFYENQNGIRPAEEFLNSLNDKMIAKAVAEIDLLAEYGNRLRELIV